MRYAHKVYKKIKIKISKKQEQKREVERYVRKGKELFRCILLRDFVDFVIKIHGSRKIIVRTKFPNEVKATVNFSHPQYRSTIFFPLLFVGGFLYIFFFCFYKFVICDIWRKKAFKKTEIKIAIPKCDNVE